MRSDTLFPYVYTPPGYDPKANRQYPVLEKSKEIPHVGIETPGAHTWMVWRRNLAAFASLLFQEKLR